MISELYWLIISKSSRQRMYERPFGFQTSLPFCTVILTASYSRSFFLITSVVTYKTILWFKLLVRCPFLSLWVSLDFRTNTSYPRNLACFLALVISVFSSDSSNFNFSAINCFMSSLTWIQSSLLPIIPIRKSSAYLTYFRRFIFASISSLAGYFRRSLTISLICRSEEHTSELQSRQYLVCRLLLEKKNTQRKITRP